MILEEFNTLCRKDQFPAGLSRLLEALWYDARGDWHTAHRIVQEIPKQDGSWIHAYLHRQEGDLANAAYWYSRAGRSKPDIAVQDEWNQIVSALLLKFSK